MTKRTSKKPKRSRTSRRPRARRNPAFRMVSGAQLSPATQKRALNMYVHRFTGTHKPSWAREPMPGGGTYPVQFRDDQDWLRNTEFAVKKDGSLDMRARHSVSHPTWPFGKSTTPNKGRRKRRSRRNTTVDGAKVTLRKVTKNLYTVLVDGKRAGAVDKLMTPARTSGDTWMAHGDVAGAVTGKTARAAAVELARILVRDYEY